VIFTIARTIRAACVLALTLFVSCGQVVVNEIRRASSGGGATALEVSGSPNTLSISNSSPSAAYGSDNTPTFVASLSDGNFAVGDVVTLHEDGDNSCSGAVVDTATLASAESTVLLSASLAASYGDHTYHVKVNRGATSYCQASSGTYHLLQSLSVLPQYTYGTNWNDYAKADDSASCVGNEALPTDCVHGGEAKIVYTSYASCAGLSMTDALGIFDWGCAVVGGYAQFTTTLKTTKGLRDLVTVAGWNANSVTLSGGLAAQSSSSTTWWTNTTAALPTGATAAPVDLAATGRIYVASATTNTNGYSITADKVGIVTLGAITLTSNVRATFNPSTALPDASSAGHAAYIGSQGARHLWIEAKFGRDPAVRIDKGLIFDGVLFSRVHRSTFDGIHASDGTNGAVGYLDDDGMSCTSTASVAPTAGRDAHGLRVLNSEKNTFSYVTVSNVRGGDGKPAVADVEAYCNSTAGYENFPGHSSSNGGHAVGLYFSAGSYNAVVGLELLTVGAGRAGDDLYSSFLANGVTCTVSAPGMGTSGEGIGVQVMNENNFDMRSSGIFGVLSSQPNSSYSPANQNGGSVYAIYVSGAADFSLRTTVISNISASSGGASAYSTTDPCTSSPINPVGGHGGWATGVYMTGSSDFILSGLIFNDLHGGDAGTSDLYSLEAGAPDTAPKNGGELRVLDFRGATNGTAETIAVNTSYSGTPASGYMDALGGLAYSNPGSPVYGVIASDTADVYLDGLTMASVFSRDAADGNNPDSGGHIYMAFADGSSDLTAGNFSITTSSTGNGADNLLGGNGGDGGNLYGTYDVTTGVLSTFGLFEINGNNLGNGGSGATSGDPGLAIVNGP
jgi:hypothetical protein